MKHLMTLMTTLFLFVICMEGSAFGSIQHSLHEHQIFFHSFDDEHSPSPFLVPTLFTLIPVATSDILDQTMDLKEWETIRFLFFQRLCRIYESHQKSRLCHTSKSCNKDHLCDRCNMVDHKEKTLDCNIEKNGDRCINATSCCCHCRNYDEENFIPSGYYSNGGLFLGGGFFFNSFGGSSGNGNNSNPRDRPLTGLPPPTLPVPEPVSTVPFLITLAYLTYRSRRIRR